MSNKLTKKKNKKKSTSARKPEQVNANRAAKGGAPETASAGKKPKMAWIVAGICVLVVIIAAAVFFVQKGKNDNSDASSVGDASADASSASGPIVTISVKDYGDIVVQLDEEAAPLSVENFVNLVKEGFYDGLTFHRIIDGFMIQGGDPNGDGTGGSDQTIKGEFSSNGVDNPISHKRGVISMARSNDPDSASSQFFIVQSDSTYLDGDYAGFGYVTSGMDIVDQICKDVPVQDDNGTVAAEDQPVIEKITVEE